MDEETRGLLKEILDLSRENNKMLHGLHRAAVWGRLSRLIYWAIIIMLSIGLYNYLQPLLTSVLKGYQSMIDNANAAGSAVQNVTNADTTQIKSAIDKMVGQQ
jgi:hypothetical protein